MSMLTNKDYIPPELCKLTHEPFDDDNYLFEPKLDGIRCLAYISHTNVTLINRAFHDVTNRFPDVLPYLSTLPDCILDGEMVILNTHGVPDFQRMQTRMNRKNLIATYALISPATYVAFDCLSYEGQSLLDSTLQVRKRYLHIVFNSTNPVQIQTIPYMIKNGVTYFASLADQGWEGIVAKPLHSIYRPGKRSEWKKVKVSQVIDAVILGCTHGTGRRAQYFGALALGIHTDEGMQYIGEVGTGFTDEDLATLLSIMRGYRMPNDPADPNIKFYVEPRIQVRIKYLERTNEGLLRFPVYKGVRAFE